MTTATAITARAGITGIPTATGTASPTATTATATMTACRITPIAAHAIPIGIEGYGKSKRPGGMPGLFLSAYLSAQARPAPHPPGIDMEEIGIGIIADAAYLLRQRGLVDKAQLAAGQREIHRLALHV